MKKYLNIARTHFKATFMEEMEYRANFIVWLIIQFFWTIADLIFFSAVANFGPIGTWTKHEALIAFGVLRLLLFPAWGWMFENFSRLPLLISTGGLDMLLTKPVDSQFVVSSKRYSFTVGLSSLISAPIMILIGVKNAGLTITLPQFLIFVWLLIVGTALMYGVYFLTMTTLLFSDRINNIHHLFTAFFDAARLPKEVYTGLTRLMITTIVPISIMTNIPAETLFRFPDVNSWIMLHLLAIGFILVGRSVWRLGLRRYSSASS